MPKNTIKKNQVVLKFGKVVGDCPEQHSKSPESEGGRRHLDIVLL